MFGTTETDIQSALTASGWPANAATLHFSPGSSFTITNGISLNGGGASSTPELHITGNGATITTTTAGTTMFTVTNSIVSATRIKFRGLQFLVNAGAAATAILLNNAELVDITGCEFTGSFSTGIKTTGTSSYNRVSNCGFASMARGIWLNSQSFGFQIVNNSFAEGLSGSPLNWIESDNGSGPASNVIVANNMFYGSAATLPTIELLNGDQWNIVNNQFYLSEKESIWLGTNGNFQGSTISGNNFNQGKRHDIYINGSRENVISNNIFGNRHSSAADNTFAAVRIANTFGGAAGSNNVIMGNRSTDAAARLTNIVEADAGCDWLTIVGNSGAADFVATGANNIIQHNSVN